MDLGHPIVAVVTRETRLAGLKARWATARQAAFRLQQAAAHEVEFRRKRRAHRYRTAPVADDAELAVAAEALADDDEYKDEDRVYQESLTALLREIDVGYPLKTVDRGFLPNFDFGRCVLVVVIGQDGLVANTAKYAGNLPIIGVNPDPSRNDGVLLPFEVSTARKAVRRVVEEKAQTRNVTMAEVNTNDGQRMLAFNDFFVGASSHVSARYTLETGGRREQQSSSGVLVSTGAGSTGWLSSLLNMTNGLSRAFGSASTSRLQLNWEDRRLVWAVREPFRSRHSGADLVAGIVEEDDELVLGSQMPSRGVIFSDGIEDDYLEFSSGTIARFTVSSQQARLVVP
jgi:NAD kinase